MTYINAQSAKHMRGFSLVETMIALTIISSLVLFSLYWQKISDNANKGRILGQQYVTLNDSVNNYMVTHAQNLSALNPICSEVTFSFDPYGIFETAQSRSPTRMAANCQLTIAKNVTVSNGLQPTVEELVALGFYPRQDTYEPRLKMNLLVKDSSADGSAPTSSTPYTSARFFININQLCLQRGTVGNPSQANAISTLPSSSGCPSNATTALSSLIFNTQPYYFNSKDSLGSFAFPTLISSALLTMGADALRSDYSDTGYFFAGELRNVNTTYKNPIRYINSKNIDIGLNGIIAMRGGYGASYANQHSRIDGSNPPTADWSFGGHSITDVNNLTVLSGLSADTAFMNKLKLSTHALNTVCDNTVENIALQGESLLICRQGVWSNLLRGTVNVNEYYQLSFSNDLLQLENLSFTYCKDSVCSSPTSMGSFTSSNKVISTQLQSSDWVPVIQGFSYANSDPSVTPTLGLLFGMNPDGTHFVSLNYQNNKDLAKLQVRFYRINS